MSVVLITGSAGLIGPEAALYFGGMGFHIVGIGNDMRRQFLGEDGSNAWNISRLDHTPGANGGYSHLDVRDREAIGQLFKRYRSQIKLVIHTAAQPSHDWAAKEPFTDFDINAVGTLNLLEATQNNCPQTPFIFASTNKVYGDTPNRLPLVEQERRWEIDPSHTYAGGIREDMSIDHSLHSVFGAPKVAADVMMQEYGRYFDLPTVCFRGGTLTRPNHAAAELHGFLAYVMRCAMTGTHYTVYGYQGKQVRDVIHSHDLIRAFHEVFQAPRIAEVYNIGGGRYSSCSVPEAMGVSEQIAGREMAWSYADQNRIGDHIWWIGDNSRFEDQYPNWSLKYDVDLILKEIHDANFERWTNL